MVSHQATTPSTSAIATAGMPPLARQPERPDRERRKRHRQSQPQRGPGQIRKIDGERSPCDDENQDQKLDSSDQPAEQRRHEAAIS